MSNAQDFYNAEKGADDEGRAGMSPSDGEVLEKENAQLREQLAEAREEARLDNLRVDFTEAENVSQRAKVAKTQRRLKSQGLKWHNDKVDRNKKLKEAQGRIAKLEEENFILRRVSSTMGNVLFSYDKEWRKHPKWERYLKILEKEALQRKEDSH